MLLGQAQLSPASRLRQMAAFPSGMKRPLPSRGMTYTVFGSRGWTPIGKPKSLGSPALISCQESPPSLLR